MAIVIEATGAAIAASQRGFVSHGLTISGDAFRNRMRSK